MGHATFSTYHSRRKNASREGRAAFPPCNGCCSFVTFMNEIAVRAIHGTHVRIVVALCSAFERQA